ncbi:hypothetical protein [Fibrella aquatilis]|uniref:CarboxypepD_reg-like domain-containing protein n=1 Tax=Fibrella aquatilis TaxID=2817059 RepID=A0A939G1R4_9BACT|nr:hypothetical protein [Fibrella aquatilis]MBO0929638.1 hypothetical protein [Fibrella aquatilis]
MKQLFTWVLCIGYFSAFGQSRVVTGKVIDEELQALPGVMIFSLDSTQLGVSGLDGSFQISLPLTRTRVLFNMVGLDQNNVDIPVGCDKAEVVLLLASTYDFMTLKAINKARYKRFKTLTATHRAAYAQGAFKRRESCVEYVFVSD